MGKHLAEYWEFPGGKREPGETYCQALRRELLEEIGVEVLRATPLTRVEHDYGERHVTLDVWWVEAFSGEPVGREGQSMRWVPVTGLRECSLPAADQPVVELLERRAIRR